MPTNRLKAIRASEDGATAFAESKLQRLVGEYERGGVVAGVGSRKKFGLRRLA